jgi:hypothetical protein
MQRHSAMLVAGLCAACLGAGIALQQGGDTPLRAPAPTTVRQQDEIDKAKAPRLQAVPAPPDLGDRAFAHVRTLVGFGPRHTGAQPTPGWTQQLDHIGTTLRGFGLAPERDVWTDRKELVTFCNVRATIPGKRKDRIVLACHHDTKCTSGHADPAHNFTFTGANDGASGVGLLLALAEVLSKQQHEATIELVFFDGEESLDWAWNDAARALFGSKRFVKQHRDRSIVGDEPRIAAMVLLDMVGRTDLHIQEELYSTHRLRELVYGAAVATGHATLFFQRAEAASDDHKPFLEVGIPAVDLVDLNGNPHWHKATDTIENVSAASLQKVGEVVLTLLPAIEREYVLRKD